MLRLSTRSMTGDTEPFAGPVHEGQLISIVIFVLAVGWMVLHKVHWVGKKGGDSTIDMEELSVTQRAD